MTSLLSLKNKIKECYDSTIESGKYKSLDLTNPDYYSVFCSAASENSLYTVFNCNMCMFNYKYDGEDSVLIIFGIPIITTNEDIEGKHVSERTMEIVKVIEELFVSIDYMQTKNAQEDKFLYLTIVKKVKEN